MDLAVIWPNKFWSGEFHGKMVVRSVGHVAIGTDKISSGEFCVFHGKWSFVSLGVTMEVLLVM